MFARVLAAEEGPYCGVRHARRMYRVAGKMAQWWLQDATETLVKNQRRMVSCLQMSCM